MQPKSPSPADIKLAILRLLALPDDDEKLTESDLAFLRSDLVRTVLRHWRDGFLGMKVSPLGITRQDTNAWEKN